MADGAGSAAHSGPGAQVAVDGFIDCVVAALKDSRVAQLPDDVPRAWLQAMRSNVLDEAAKAGRPAQEYACTFLAVVAGEDAGIFLQLGDGFIAVQAADVADWEVACEPQRGEYVNQTWFLTGSDALDRAEIRRWSGRISNIAVTTDGLENVCLDRKTGLPFHAFFDGLIATVLAAPGEEEDQLDAGLARFLESSRLDEYTSDDKTLVLATRLKG
jgi:Protein phosphatase 2C